MVETANPVPNAFRINPFGDDMIDQLEEFSCVGTFQNALDAYTFINNNQVDVLFLDVEMPKMGGIELLKNLENPPLVVMITSHDEFALESYEYNDTPILQGSALAALNGEQSGVDSVMELMKTVDTWIETPVRDEAKAFLMSVEDVFSITGRGTVATGAIETGIIRTGDPVDIVGLSKRKCLLL